MSVWRSLLLGLGALAVLVTAVPFLPSNDALVRIWDFPRQGIAGLLAAVLIATPFAWPRTRRTFGFVAVLAAALAWQVVAIWPYTPLGPTQAAWAESCPADARLSSGQRACFVFDRAANRKPRHGGGLSKLKLFCETGLLEDPVCRVSRLYLLINHEAAFGNRTFP